MYTLIQEHRQSKWVLLQFLFLGSAFLITEKFVEYLVDEKQLFPESFILESSIFLTIWLSLDTIFCAISRDKSCLKSLFNKTIAKFSLISLALSLLIAEIFFKFHSFLLEYSSMLVLWFLLDFLISKLTNKKA